MNIFVPVFEAKNKLPFYLHQAEDEGPVFITRHDKTAGVLISAKDYDEIKNNSEKKTFIKSIFQWREKYKEDIEEGMFEDLADFFENTKDKSSDGSFSEKQFIKEFCK